MEPSNALKAKTLALAIAIGVGGPVTAARADELHDLKAQVDALQKKIGEMETKQPVQQSGSMGTDYAKGLPFVADDGSLTGRGTPWIRGLITGSMTALGGVGHTLPYLMHNFSVATGVAILVVIVELAVITWLRHRFMDTPPLSAALQVALGGALVFITGILIGNS